MKGHLTYLASYLSNLNCLNHRMKIAFLWFSGSWPAFLGKTRTFFWRRVCSVSLRLNQMSVSWKSIWVRTTFITWRRSKTAMLSPTTGKSSCERCKIRFAHLSSTTRTWTWPRFHPSAASINLTHCWSNCLPRTAIRSNLSSSSWGKWSNTSPKTAWRRTI